MVESTGVPIGLVACAHGGTSMEQWNPSKKEQGGHSLYGSMLRQVKEAGGKVKGVLWYQGESDALGEAKPGRLIPRSSPISSRRSGPTWASPSCRSTSCRSAGSSAGPIPRAGTPFKMPSARSPERVPNTAVVSVIDLELDDGIHVGTQGQKRAGQRLARIAQRELFGQLGATTPTLDRVSEGPHNTLVVKFKGVNMSAAPGRHVMGTSRGGMVMGMRGGGIDQPRRCRERRAQARAPHRRLLDPQRGWNQHPAHLRGGRRQGARHRYPEAHRAGARERIALVRLWARSLLQPDRRARHGRAGLRADRARRNRACRDRPQPRHRLGGCTQDASGGPVKVLIITGDTSRPMTGRRQPHELTEILEAGGKIKVDVTTTPSKDLTDENLAKYDVLLLTTRTRPQAHPRRTGPRPTRRRS